MSDDDLVVLVDEDGRDLGTAPKLDAHRAPGLRHRAFSVFVATSDGRVLLQRRAAAKYHFPGLWSNACCSHPRPGEAVAAAARRRLPEEVGLSCPLEEVGTFAYEAADPVTGLVERELDHVLVGCSDAVPAPDPAEVAEVRLVPLAALVADVAGHPEAYTPWLAAALAVAAPALRRPPA